MLLKKIAEEYCEKRKYSIEDQTMSHFDEKLSVKAFDVKKVRHSLTIEVDNIDRREVYVSDKCMCKYNKQKNVFTDYNDNRELFRGKDFKVEISNLWMDVYSKLLLEAGKRNMEEKGGVWSDTEMYVAELTNIYCDTHEKYEIDKIEEFIENEFGEWNT